ncbi:hypothetical protein [Myxococcus sp. RHSTA-1-4]|uniref:hypothetical protein n=1 Tax=Myxococcus sp. RHSTA-1-4 TaxID=2874601 RepID=UPI001CBADBC9|nr:hypothetical protein [Myxococcus sp. RHSTA-1-4]MBZ4420942.1 hypothetical protein [Myxococcus sp. RHSTA-1-4]
MRLASSRTRVPWFLGACLLLGGPPALAQEQQEKASGAYLSAMTGPLERVEATAEELGIPLPSFLRREFIEGDLPFLGPGSLRAAGSLGMWMGPTEPGADSPNATMLFPLKPGVAPLRDFLDRGARRLSPKSDTVERGGYFFRRTEGFLLMGASKVDITTVDPEAVGKRLGAPGVLAEVDLDLDRWRTTDPASFRQMLSQGDPSDGAGNAEALGNAIGTRLIEKLVDRVHLTVMDAAPTPALRLRVALEPLAPEEAAPFPRPSFPRTSVGRVDITYASTETSRWMLGLTDDLLDAVEKDNGFADAAKAGIRPDQMRALFKELFGVFWVADSLSMAVEPSGSGFIYHQVNQYRQPADFTARLNTVLKGFRDADKKAIRRNKKLFASTTYTAGGARITRVALPDNLNLDFVDSGTMVRITVAQDKERHLPALLNAPSEGSIASIFSGSVDTGALLAAFPEARKGLPPALALTLDSLRGQLISWNTRPEGKAAVMELEVPKQLIQAVFRRGHGAEPSTSSPVP